MFRRISPRSFSRSLGSNKRRRLQLTRGASLNRSLVWATEPSFLLKNHPKDEFLTSANFSLLEYPRTAVKEAVKESKKNKRTENRFSAIMDGEEEEDLVASDAEEEEEEVEEVEDIDLEEIEGGMEMDKSEAANFALFMGKGGPGGLFGEGETRKSLNDVILEKLMAHEKKKAGIGADDGTKLSHEEALERVQRTMNPKVVEAYALIAKLLKHYSSGRLPKAFNIIPALSNWEEILYLTRPHEWSPAAVRAATRVFASNLNHHLAQRYYSLVLFPRIRYDIDSHKKLNWHLYMALKKALWKPDAFYKGILLPLCDSGDCTLKEATIIASLLKKVSIPSAHSSVALFKIAQMPYSGPNAMFIGVLLNKKYALPYEVVDSVVEHFLRVREEKETPPVLWHQSLLVFAQRYKNELTHEQKEALKGLIRQHNHHLISPEIRRELLASRNREDDPNTEIPEVMDGSSKRRKPKHEVRPSFALPGQVPYEDGDDSDDGGNAMEE
jgi:essential nuclear protein 1